MSVISRIAAHDLKLAWRELWAIWFLMTLAVLSIYAVLHGRASVEREIAALNRLAASEEENLRHHQRVARQVLSDITSGKLPNQIPPEYGPLHAQYVKNFAALSAALPPAPLAALSDGWRELYPHAYKMVLNDSFYTFPTPEPTESPVKLLFGHFDLVLVIVSLYSLGVIAISFSMLDAEREAGLLGLLLSNPISYLQLAWGKLLSRWALVLLAAAVMFAASVVGTAGPAVAAGNFWRLLCWAAAIALYGLFWLTLCWAVSTIPSSAAWKVSALAAIWLAVVVVVPSGLRIIAAAQYPVAPRVEFIETLRNTAKLVQAKDDVLREQFFRKRPEYRRDTPYPWMGNNQVRTTARSEAVAEAMENLSDQYEGQLRRQRKLVQQFAWLSPALTTESILINFAGTGFERHEHFVGLVKMYDQQWKAFFWPRIFEERVFPPDDYDRMPRFTFQEEAANDLLDRSWLPFSWLVSSILLLSIIGFTRSRKLQPGWIS